MWRIFPVFLCIFLASGCATIGQKNHGQPFILPDDLKEQIAGKRIHQVESWKRPFSHCTQEVPRGNFHIPREAWAESATMINAPEQPGDYEIRYVFGDCEGFGTGDTHDALHRSFFNFILSALTATIIPTFYDSYTDMTVIVTRDGQQIFQGTYREVTDKRVFGLVAIPLKLVEWAGRGPVNESTQLTAYRNLARQFNQDVATEFIFE